MYHYWLGIFTLRFTFQLAIGFAAISMISGCQDVGDELAYNLQPHFETPGKILPLREWLLVKTNEGDLLATLQDHQKGITEAYAINRFERGDAVRFALQSNIASRTELVAGDTVGSLLSSEAQIRLAELEGERNESIATLEMFIAGDKPALIEEARQRIVRAEARLNEHTRELNRIQSLWDKQLVAADEYERAQALHEEYTAEVAIAQARLRSRQTGSRQEKIALAQTEIAAFDANIESLISRIAHQTITAPFSGKISQSFSADTLLTLRDTEGYLVLMPIALENRLHLEIGMDVEIILPDKGSPITGSLLTIGDTIHMLDGKQVLPSLALIDYNQPDVLIGMMVNTSISIPDASFATYIKHLFN